MAQFIIMICEICNIQNFAISINAQNNKLRIDYTKYIGETILTRYSRYSERMKYTQDTKYIKLFVRSSQVKFIPSVYYPIFLISAGERKGVSYTARYLPIFFQQGGRRGVSYITRHLHPPLVTILAVVVIIISLFPSNILCRLFPRTIFGLVFFSFLLKSMLKANWSVEHYG